MARLVTPLTATKIQNAKPKVKDYKLSDGQGLYLLIKPSGGKLWRFKYRFEGKEKVMALGKYPEVSLVESRQLRATLREQIANGLDPIQIKKEEASLQKIQQVKEAYSFKKISLDYLDKRNELSEAYIVRLRASLKNDAYDYIGNTTISDITPKDIIDIIKRVEERGAVEGAHRLFTQLNKIFKYAVSNQVCERNPCSEIDKKEILKAPKKRNYPTITDPKEIKNLLQAIDGYGGAYTTRMALLLAPHVFVRPYNLRFAEWSEIDFDAKLWRIPAHKMKTKVEHLVPLTDQTLAIFNEVYQHTADAKYIFHSLRSKTSQMSDAALNNALRRMGYSQDELVVHGFRAMFSTIAHEVSSFKHEVIETQLAHSVGTKVSQAYNRALYLDERKELMKWWSNYLSDLQKNKSF